MKDLLEQIKETTTNKFVKQFEVSQDKCDPTGKLMLHLFSMLEESLTSPKTIIEQIAPAYKKELLNIDFQKMEEALAGEELEVEMRFYSIDKKTVQLKAFARTFSNKGKAKKIAKTTYTYKAVYIERNAA
jgi:hypothetical protein